MRTEFSDTQMGAIPASRWKVRREPNAPRLAPKMLPSSIVGVTIASPQYERLAIEAARRFRAATGLDVIILWAGEEPAYAMKLNLDLLIAPRPVVFFDADLWMLRPFDFSTLDFSKFSAVPDPCASSPGMFPYLDCQREGWNPAEYFNSGLFACDLEKPEIRDVFWRARVHLAECHGGAVKPPSDWTDQYFLNAAVKASGRFAPLPWALNCFKFAVDRNVADWPRKVIGLHAAGVPVARKLETLHAEAAVFGTQQSSYAL